MYGIQLTFEFLASILFTWGQLSQKNIVLYLRQFKESFMVASLDFLKKRLEIQENLQKVLKITLNQELSL